MSAMTIGRLATDAGVPIDTIRYYERNGLLPAPQRRVSGYRSYAPADIERLRFIRRAKAEERLAQVEHKIEALKRVRRGLKELIAACPGHGELEVCPIVAALSGRACHE